MKVVFLPAHARIGHPDDIVAVPLRPVDCLVPCTPDAFAVGGTSEEESARAKGLLGAPWDDVSEQISKKFSESNMLHAQYFEANYFGLGGKFRNFRGVCFLDGVTDAVGWVWQGHTNHQNPQAPQT